MKKKNSNNCGYINAYNDIYGNVRSAGSTVL